MDKAEFAKYRKTLGKTQQQTARLLGTSLKAIHSYEQGWRSVPFHVERQLLFLVSRTRKNGKSPKTCWTVKKCPPERKKLCPAWEFRVGRLCWFVNGTICEGHARKDWKEKMEICRSCEILSSLL